MELSPIWKDTFLQILREELIPAMGCTEPIAIAYGAARAREVLGCLPEEVLVEASGNLIKNVKSVIVPNTNGLSGIGRRRADRRKAGKTAGGHQRGHRRGKAADRGLSGKELYSGAARAERADV